MGMEKGKGKENGEGERGKGRRREGGRKIAYEM